MSPETSSAIPSGPLSCERCGQPFHCGARDAAPCACTTLRLSPAQRDSLAAQYRHCLCLACLAAIAAGAPQQR